MSLDRELRMAVTTGKVHFGSKAAMRELRRGKGRMAILASNCPEETRSRLEAYGRLAGVPMVRHFKDSLDLGGLLGRPFPVSVIVINDPGDSKILGLVKA